MWIKNQKHWLYYVLIILCMFPFCGIHIGADTQPWAFLMACVCLLICGRFRVFYQQWYALTILIIGIIFAISLYYLPMMSVIRRMFSYASILVIPIAVYNIPTDNKTDDTIERVLKVCIWLWLIVGLIQLLFNRMFMAQFIPNMRTTISRGATGLANEPSFYGYMCFFFFLFAMQFQRKKYFYMVLAVFQVLFVAQSAMGILYFVVFVTVYVIGYIVQQTWQRWVLIGGAVVSFVFLIQCMKLFLPPQGRLTILFNNFRYYGVSALLNDESGKERIEAVLAGFSHHGFPGLIGEKILMSGLGGVIYELGIFAIPLFMILLMLMIQGNRGNLAYVQCIAVMVALLFAIQLSSPTLALYIGLCGRRIMKESLLREQYEYQNQSTNSQLC